MLLLFLEYDFSVIYKPERSHFVADALSQMPNFIKESGVPYQTMDLSLFLLQPMWLQEISKYLITKKILVQYSQEQKKKLTLRALHFSLI
jgi:hypothetical protein